MQSSFKIHLIIIAAIIVTVYVIWQLSTPAPAPVVAAAPKPVEDSPFSILISHASWGLNCRAHPRADAGAFQSDSSKIREDNVLMRVSALCNGKTECAVPLDPATLGDDPSPECRSKMLDVEYRCFSYDRPWTAHAASGSLLINCHQKPAP